MEQSIQVELTDVAKCYGMRRLFEHININVKSGEHLAVTGPNGSGKSTLLKIIAGLVRPSAGTVQLLTNGNQKIGQSDRARFIGLISPEIVFYSSLTAYENIRLLTRAAGMNVSPEDIKACLQTLGLLDRFHDLVANYSTGMHQRLKFALLLALQPPLWLLDEPSSNLDAAGKQLIADLIQQALASQTAIIMATNEAEEANYAQKKISLA